MRSEKLLEIIQPQGIFGVPDSAMKGFSNHVIGLENHICTPDEGSAVSLAIGEYLATEKISLVYMQNSGFGNTINSITSMADNDVYGVPMILMIGWRGEGKDEPQHKKMGRITLSLMETLDIKYIIIDNEKDYEKEILELKRYAIENSTPVVIIVRKDTFDNDVKLEPTNGTDRMELIDDIIKKNPNALFISTTGFTSRELMYLRGYEKESDFYSIGGMGFSGTIAMGVAKNTNKDVICLDGDGSFLMQLGSNALFKEMDLKNFYHYVFDNGVHASVGGQPITTSLNFNIIAKEFGYTPNENFFHIKVSSKTHNDLPRPKLTPKEIKERFMNEIKS